MKHPKAIYTRLMLVLGILMLLGLSFETAIFAESFPTKEIEIVINTAPGGSTDTMARIVGDKVAKLLGVPVICSNKLGAGGAVAANYVAKAKPDGYTIGTVGGSNLGTILATSEKIPYRLEEFSGIARAVIVPHVFVSQKGRFENFESFIKEVKQKPGVMTFGSWGAKSTAHIMGELISQIAGLKMKHVPFDGGAKGLAAVMGGHIDVAITTPSTSLSNLRAGTLTGLAVSSENRLEGLLPDIPTLAELGYSQASFYSFDGFGISSKVPLERLSIIRSAFEKVIKDPETQEALKKAGMIPNILIGNDYDAFLLKNLSIVKNVAIKADLIKN